MTIDEAISYISVSHVLDTVSAHIIDPGTRSGKSTRDEQKKLNISDVTYGKSYKFLDDLSWIHEIGDTINVSTAFPNPKAKDSEESIAFANYITIYEGDTPKFYYVCFQKQSF